MPSRRAEQAAVAAVAVVVTVGAATVVEAATLGMGWPLRVATVSVLGLGVAALVQTGLVRPLRRAIGVARWQAAKLRRDHDHTEQVRQTAAAAARALRQAEGELEVYAVLAEAASRLLPDHDLRLLVLDGAACRAAATGCTAVAASTVALDACRHARGGTEVSSACVPLVTTEGTRLVLHATGPVGDVPEGATIDALEWLADAATGRLAVPAPDAGAAAPRSVALVDVDGFAAYCDAHGEQAGREVLEVVERSLRSALRPGDDVRRHRDDLFVAVLNGCGEDQATAAMERVRERVLLEQVAAGMPPFRLSAGVAAAATGDEPDTVIGAADIALSVAKREGGGRVRAASFAGEARRSR